MNRQPSDKECFQNVLRGGRKRRDGITELYRRYADKFARYYIRHRISRDEAEDIVQDTFVKIVKGCESFRGECEVSGWLWRIAKNSMISHIRKQRPNIPFDETEFLADANSVSHANPHQPIDSAEECVQWALEQFEKEHAERAQVLTLAAIEGWDTREVSEFIGRTLGATREYISQCRKHFSKYVEPCYEYLSA